MARNTHADLSVEDFLKAYMEAWVIGKGSHDLAKELGLSHNSVMSRAGNIRRAGVEVPYLNSSRKIKDKIPILKEIVVGYRRRKENDPILLPPPAEKPPELSLKHRGRPIKEQLPMCTWCNSKPVQSKGSRFCSDDCVRAYLAAKRREAEKPTAAQ